MPLSAHPATLEAIRPFRGIYRMEMACQIIHDSIHDPRRVDARVHPARRRR
jgi:hypothetical protein